MKQNKTNTKDFNYKLLEKLLNEYIRLKNLNVNKEILKELQEKIENMKIIDNFDEDIKNFEENSNKLISNSLNVSNDFINTILNQNQLKYIESNKLFYELKSNLSNKTPFYLQTIEKFQKNEMFNWMKHYINIYLHSDIENNIYKDLLTNENGKLSLITGKSKDFMLTMFDRINSKSMLFKKINTNVFEKDNKEYIVINNKLYLKLKNGNYKLQFNSFNKKQQEAKIIDNKLYLKNNKNYTLKSDYKYHKKKENIVEQSVPFSFSNGVVGIDISQSGNSDLIMFDEISQKFIVSDTTISHNSDIENDSILRHYIDFAVLLEKNIEGKKLKEHLLYNVTEEKIKDLMKRNFKNILEIKQMTHSDKINFLLNSLQIPLNDLSLLKNNKKDNNDNIRITEEIMIKILNNISPYLNFSYQFNELTSIKDTVLFLLSSTGNMNTIDNITYDFDSLIEFFSKIDKEVIGKNGDKLITKNEIVDGLSFFKNFINNKINLEEIEDKLNDENFVKILFAISYDIFNNGNMIFNVDFLKINKLVKIIEQKNKERKFNNLNSINKELESILFSIDKLSKNIIDFNNQYEISKLIIKDFDNNLNYTNLLDKDYINQLKYFLNKDKLEDFEKKTFKVVLNQIFNEISIDKKKEIILKFSLKEKNNQQIDNLKINNEKKELKKYLINNYNLKDELMFFENNIDIIINILKKDGKFKDLINNFEYITFNKLNTFNKDFDKLKNKSLNKNYLKKIVSQYNKKDIKNCNILEIEKLIKILVKNYNLTQVELEEIIKLNFNNDINYCYNYLMENYFMGNTLNYIPKVDNLSTINLINEKFINNRKLIYINDNDNDGASCNAIETTLNNNNDNNNNDNNIYYSKDTNETRGINFNHLDNILKNEKDLKNITIVTADNGSNNINEIEKILNKYPEIKIVITDHHKVNKESFNFYRNNSDKTILLNSYYSYDLNYNNIKENNFGKSGARTLKELIINNKNYNLDKNDKITLEKISQSADYMDMINSEITVTKNVNELATFSNQLNTLPNIEKYIKITKNNKYFNYVSLINNYNYILNNNNINNENEITQYILNNKNKINNFDIIKLRSNFIYLYSKINKTPKEIIIFNQFKNLLKKSKDIEKEIIEDLKKEKNLLINEKITENCHYQLFDNKFPKKLLLKAFPPKNKTFKLSGFEIDDKFYGSFRSNISYENLDINNNCEIAGHSFAAGLKCYISDIDNLLKKIDNKCNENNNNNLSKIITIDDLEMYSELNTILNTTNNIKNYNKELVISVFDLKKYGMTNKGKDTNFDNITEIDNQFIRMVIDFNGTTLLINKDFILDAKENDKISFKYSGNKSFFSTNLIKNTNINNNDNDNNNNNNNNNNNDNNTLNETNNFTKQISLDEYKEYQTLNLFSENEINNFFKEILKILETHSYYSILDIEGTGFGKNIGMTNYGAFTFTKNKNNKLEIFFTSAILKNDKVSPAIQKLTHIDFNILKKGTDYKTVEKSLLSFYNSLSKNNKKGLFQAHNFQYDFNGIFSNMKNLGKFIDDNDKLDSAKIVRELKMVNDMNHSYLISNLNYNNNIINLGTFIESKMNDENSFKYFVSNFKNNTIYNSITNETSIKYVLDNNNIPSVKITVKGLELDLISYKDFKSNLKLKEKKATTKYSVQEMVGKVYSDTVKNEIIKDILNNDEKNVKINGLNLLKNISSSKIVSNIKNPYFLENEKDFLYNKLLFENLICKNDFNNLNINNIINKYNKKIERLKNKITKINFTKYKKEETKTKYKKIVIDLKNYINNLKLDLKNINKNLKNIDLIEKDFNILFNDLKNSKYSYLFTNSKKIKEILYSFDETLYNLNKEQYINNIVLKIGYDKEIIIKIIEIILKLKNNNSIDFQKNLKELHYNINPEDSDVKIESFIIQYIQNYMKHSNNEKTFKNIFNNSIKQTNKMLSKSVIKRLNDDLGNYSDIQMITKLNKTKIINKGIIGINLKYKVFVDFKDNINVESEKFNNIKNLLENYYYQIKLKNSLYKTDNSEEDLNNILKTINKEIDFIKEKLNKLNISFSLIIPFDTLYEKLYENIINNDFNSKKCNHFDKLFNNTIITNEQKNYMFKKLSNLMNNNKENIDLLKKLIFKDRNLNEVGFKSVFQKNFDNLFLDNLINSFDIPNYISDTKKLNLNNSLKLKINNY